MTETSDAVKKVDVIDCSKCRYASNCGIPRFTRSIEGSWNNAGKRIRIVIADCSEH